jgi:prophage antirepressor-like protein
MSLEVQVFDNLKVKEENGQILFDAETAAIGLGLTQVKSHKTYVQWKRVNNYLNNLSAHVRNSNSPLVEKGDFITEPQLYKLAIKANSAQAEKFQEWVTSEVLPAIRKTGGYSVQQSTQLNETLSGFESRLKHLEQANLLSAIQYNHLGRLVANRVSEVENSFDFEILPIQHIELTKDINEGIYRISGVKSRTQLQSKDYDMVIKFVTEWQPSTATQVVINNIQERQLCS